MQPSHSISQFSNHKNEAEPVFDFDIGTIDSDFLSPSQVEEVLRRGHQKMPDDFPRDRLKQKVSRSLLFKILPNGEKVKRDWLVWSLSKKSFFCLPCRLFDVPGDKSASRSLLCSPSGFSNEGSWKKLYDRLPQHENNKHHIQCFVKWRQLETRIENESTIDKQLCEQVKNEKKKWKEILTRILDTILFLGERGLALRGESHRVGDHNNGNFLGILELISHYDPVLSNHLESVKASQESGSRLQVHYLSWDIQNEFIEICASYVISAILEERKKAKYYAILVDATPDSSHVEQTTFILRYVTLKEKKYRVKEHFLAFVDCNKKKGADIAKLICDTLNAHNIPLGECRGQGYDNGSNMQGEYEGAQAHILRKNELAVYSPCICHILNLCGVDAAECCPQAVTFFGAVQKFYTIFSCSPQRWEILKQYIPNSLHPLSTTRWSARIDAVKPFANSLPLLGRALNELYALNLTAETRSDTQGLQKYISKFECILMASIWFKILNAIDQRSKVLQAVDITIDVEMKNLESLISDLQLIRSSWDKILQECKLVATAMNVSASFPERRKRKRKKAFSEDEDSGSDEMSEENKFKIDTFLVIIDAVISGMNRRSQAIKKLNDTFSFLWTFTSIDEEHLRMEAASFVKKYSVDVSDDLEQEMLHLKNIYEANFEPNLPPLDLLNSITEKKLENLFPNICTSLRIFCTLPVSISSGERSFSVLARIKDHHRSCSTQSRTTALASLCIEAEFARKLNFNNVIDTFASLKARKANI